MWPCARGLEAPQGDIELIDGDSPIAVPVDVIEYLQGRAGAGRAWWAWLGG